MCRRRSERGGEAPSDDPYALRTSDIKEPPRDLRGTVRRLGPGMILSAAVNAVV
ncbi:hypothetical protein [Streptomyces hygroscopicus]|uniref:hypothetical protein n=1 Tax=Streptomyces hygroscopicus TaxID=1912 RepID=UPI000B13853C|nr:hypothetical protein [Streptomyces hygroscopicus]GLV76635.1 hypothetical protein Shyhy02_46350 [Streptomyces hygroscopicus subsp. hygroscopicus]